MMYKPGGGGEGRREKLHPSLWEICWVCAKDDIITPATTEKYGFPVCDKHNTDDIDPEELESFMIEQFRRSGM
jgi:hypothetical protein